MEECVPILNVLLSTPVELFTHAFCIYHVAPEVARRVRTVYRSIVQRTRREVTA